MYNVHSCSTIFALYICRRLLIRKKNFVSKLFACGDHSAKENFQRVSVFNQQEFSAPTLDVHASANEDIRVGRAGV